METILFVFLTFLIVAYVGYPLIEARSKKGLWRRNISNHRAIELEERKEAIYSAIKDIEFDYQMGKLSEEDFKELREKYKQEAIQLLKQIDEIKTRSLQTKAVSSKKKSKAKGMRYCWLCGTVVTKTDKFCANCGNKLQ